MGNSQSSRAKNDNKTAGSKLSSVKSVRGRESKQEGTMPGLMSSFVSHYEASVGTFEMMTNTVAVIDEDDDAFSCNSTSTDEYEEDSDEGEDLEWMEYKAILDDARKLKEAAAAYMHPEAPVKVDGLAFARCYFDRNGALDTEDAQERAAIAEDAEKMGHVARIFLHPEHPVQTSDPTSFGRNYFERPSGPEQDEEARVVLQEAAALRKAAEDFLHPERSIKTVDPSTFGRNYFYRPSGPTQDDEDCASALNDLKELKKLAVAFAHPEKSIIKDSEVQGRDYFSRPSADRYEDSEDADVMMASTEDVKALKTLARFYLHPEDEVKVDPVLMGRDYFKRSSADEAEDVHEQQRIFADLRALKQLAVDYAHPEVSVNVSDSTVFGRNYFSRPSAEVPDSEDALQLDGIIEDLQAMKQHAAMFYHPESAVNVESTMFGRNYFLRPAGVEQESAEDLADAQLSIQDAVALKTLASSYMSPETPVNVDVMAFGRNFFARPSAAEYEESELIDECSNIFNDIDRLKDLAVAYKHPEKPVLTTDYTVFARNYFGRASADDAESEELRECRSQVLKDLCAAKKSANAYLHPEKQVIADAAMCGRDFFSRHGATESEDLNDQEERERILNDANALRMAAVAYMHPETRVITSDPAACGRNFFDRPSAPLHSRAIHTFPPHEDDVHHDETEVDHLDHFGLDEELNFMFEEMRHDLKIPSGEQRVGDKLPSDEAESNLSRSPSSVMLFTGESIYD